MKQTYSLFKRGKIWYYWSYSNGRRMKRSTGKRTKAEALNYLSELMETGQFGVYKKIKFKDFAAPYFTANCPYTQDEKARGRTVSLSAKDSYRRLLDKHILPYFGAVSVSEITTQMILAWMSEKGKKLSSGTVNNMLTCLRIILDSAVTKGVIKFNPAREIKPYANTGTSKAVFTQEEINRLFSSPWDNRIPEVMSLLSASTGMRIGEICALTSKKIHKDYIEVSNSWQEKYGMKSTKSGKPRIVPITAEIYERICEVGNARGFVFALREKPVTRAYVSICLTKRMEQLGIPKAGRSFHSFRHYFNTRLVASGVSGEITRAVIGHESEDMTDRYLHLTAEDLSAVRKVQEGILK